MGQEEPAPGAPSSQGFNDSVTVARFRLPAASCTMDGRWSSERAARTDAQEQGRPGEPPSPPSKQEPRRPELHQHRPLNVEPLRDATTAEPEGCV